MHTRTSSKMVLLFLVVLVMAATGLLCLAATEKVAGHEIRLRDGRVYVGVYDEATGMITLFGAESGKDARFRFRVEKTDIESIAPRVLNIKHLTDEQKAEKSEAGNAGERRREAENNRKRRERAQRTLIRANTELARCLAAHDEYLRKSTALERGTKEDIETLSAKIKDEEASYLSYKHFLERWNRTAAGTTRSEWVKLSRMRRALEADKKQLPKLGKNLKDIQRRIRNAQNNHANEVRVLTKVKEAQQAIIKELDGRVTTVEAIKEVDHAADDAADRRVTKEITLGGGVKMKFVLIPAGEFMMGGNNEKPVHKVKITQSFYIGVHEVTQEQYEAVMGKNPSLLRGARNPVEKVSWNDAVEFCRRLSHRDGATYRLPTEAEWEYACRAGTTTRFCFGDNDSGLGDYAWYKSNSNSKTHPVGEKRANAFGLHDMHGNVWEWCQDWYDKDYYTNSPISDPSGPRSGTARILRGGSWDCAPWICRSEVHDGRTPSRTDVNYGFRITCVARP